MSNSFSKEERVAFEDILEGFQDQLVLSKNVSTYNTDGTMMARTGDVIWRPRPYILNSFDGQDQTTNFKTQTQLSVPATIGHSKSVPWTMDAKELRDALQEKRLGDSAKLRLASDINRAIMDVASGQGTLVVKRTTAATGFDDVAQCEAIFNEQGIPMNDRCIALSTRDYNGMASNLAGRQTLQGKPLTAYDRAYIGEVCSFDAFKLDYANRITAAAATGITIDTRTPAGNYYVPKATSIAPTGEQGNVDNRYQTVTLSAGTSIAVGDCFTVANCYAVHQITKQNTGQLKTFRIMSISGASAVISPPIISAQGGSTAELQYQNCVFTSTASSAALVWLNTVAASINPFWQKDALEILPSRYAVPTDAGANVMRGTTDNGFEIVMQKFYDINTMITKYRVDTLFGVVNKQPEMSGIMLFSQS